MRTEVASLLGERAGTTTLPSSSMAIADWVHLVLALIDVLSSWGATASLYRHCSRISRPGLLNPGQVLSPK